MRPLPTWRYLAQMARYAPGLCLLHALLWAVMDLSGLLPGLIAAAFFDALVGKTHTPGGTNGLVALLVALALGQSALWLVAGYAEIVMRFAMSGLLRRNLLRRSRAPSRCRTRSARPSAASATMRTRPRTASTGPTRSWSTA
ncbi:MAG TPA: hypothetical protein VFA70_12390 [Dehalococcoidia bacterium]|nr:hypothetical protein [Dehalococcoidia bacterium]